VLQENNVFREVDSNAWDVARVVATLQQLKGLYHSVMLNSSW
jgi:hypothetical protein